MRFVCRTHLHSFLSVIVPIQNSNVKMVRQNICIICTHLSMNCLLPRAINTPCCHQTWTKTWIVFWAGKWKNICTSLERTSTLNVVYTQTNDMTKLREKRITKAWTWFWIFMAFYISSFFLLLSSSTSSSSVLMCFVVWGVNGKNNRCLGLNYVIPFKSLSLN